VCDPIHVFVHWTCRATNLLHNNSNLIPLVSYCCHTQVGGCDSIHLFVHWTCRATNLKPTNDNKGRPHVLLAVSVCRLVCATLSTCLCTGLATALT
jgi:hypothetical protein